MEGSKPEHETRLRKTGRTHSNGSPVWERVKVKNDPTNPDNVPSMDDLPPINPRTGETPALQIPLPDPKKD